MGNIDEILLFVKEVEKLKDVNRTAWTTSGRRESVAEHSWRLAIFAMSLQDYFPNIDMKKVMYMCLVHDFGEIYEGDISAKFETDIDGKYDREEKAVGALIDNLPTRLKEQILDVWREYNGAQTEESKLVKALDKMETIIQHNQGKNPQDFDYEYNIQYGAEYAKYSDVLQEIRLKIDADTKDKCK